MTFYELANRMRHYFDSRNIPVYGLTVVLEWQDFQSAAKFEADLLNELKRDTRLDTGEPIDLSRAFQVSGIEFRVASPVHVRILE